MSEELRCIGCGSILQDQDPKKSGYLPTSALKKALTSDDNEVYCQRCFRLRHYNEIMPVEENNDDFLALLNSISQKKALVVNVVDLFDFSNSLISSIKRFIGGNEYILVGNKVDLYFVGTTNVGKSTLINAIINMNSDLKDVITTSKFPGTTLDEIKIPLSNGHYLIDTPGILNANQLASHLSGKELEVVEPKKPLKPATYQLLPGQTIFLAGLGRFDYVDGPSAGFTIYVARDLYVHRTKTENADTFYEKHKDDLLLPPSKEDNLGPLKGQTFSPKEKSDILFGGVGFITTPANVVVKAYTPEGIGLGIRRALI